MRPHVFGLLSTNAGLLPSNHRLLSTNFGLLQEILTFKKPWASTNQLLARWGRAAHFFWLPGKPVA